VALDHLEALGLGDGDHRAAGDAVQEAVGLGRVQHAVLDEEHVGAGRLGHIAAIVEHHRVGITVLLGGVLGDGADHVEAGGLGGDRGGLGVGALVLGPGQADALGLGGRVEVAGPFPHGDGHVDLGLLRRNTDHFAAAPGDRAHIAVIQVVLGGRRLAGLVDLGHRVGDLEIEDFGRLEQALGMLGQLEDLAPVHAFALEHRRGVVEAVGQYVHLRLAPGYELAVQPDPTIAIVEGNERHRSETSLFENPVLRRLRARVRQIKWTPTR
jgi:hypothetical protein